MEKLIILIGLFYLFFKSINVQPGFLYSSFINNESVKIETYSVQGLAPYHSTFIQKHGKSVSTGSVKNIKWESLITLAKVIYNIKIVSAIKICTGSLLNVTSINMAP